MRLFFALLAWTVAAHAQDPAVLKRLGEGGLEPLKETPQEFASRWRRDYDRFRDIVKAAGLKPE